MRNLYATSPRFPSTCARCGGVVEEPVSFCPHCGTHARLAFGWEVPRAALTVNRSEVPLADVDLASRPTPLFASSNVDNHGNIRSPMGGSSRQWGIKGGTASALFGFVLLFGGLVLLNRRDDLATRTQQATLRIAEGTVQAGAAGAGEQHDVDRSLGASADWAATPAMSTTPMPSVPAPLAPSSASAPTTAGQSDATTPLIGTDATSAQPAKVPQSAQSANLATPASSTALSVAAETDRAELSPVARDGSGQSPHTAVASVVVPSPGRPEGKLNISVPRSDHQAPARAASTPIQPAPGEIRGERRAAWSARFVETAQESLAKSNLAATRRAIAAALAAQPDNSEAFMLQQDLHSRERARDAALSAARACVVQQQWNCAWHHAGNALSIDSSSVEAKALVERSIVESGAAAKPPGPGPDGPDVPMLTQ